MILKWPTDKERIRKYMGIPPTKKMTWLYEMSKFIYKVSLAQKPRVQSKVIIPRLKT